ncbi:MAG: mandelate racemase/muconate lactonizing enzyme family protein [Chloroflexi bacterium]|nr:mandelate racemase/muconate lactonizing enzyme family protein [Chloroflexota bacterium]
MKITQISCSLLSYPLPAALHPSWAPGRTFHHTTCTLIRVRTDEGLEGIGAGPDVGLTGVYTIADLVTPYLIGKDPFAVEQISPILRHAARDGSYPWGVEMALCDLIGKACGQPVYRLWGGYQTTLPAYVSLAELHDADRRIEELLALREIGFRAAKLRLRRPTVAEDIAFVARVRRGLPADFSLMADANQAHVMPSPGPHNFWSYSDALVAARAMQDLGLLWLEEPLPRYDLKQLSALAAAVDLPIAGGELNIGLHEYKRLIDEDCYDIIQADAAFSEGIFQLRKVAALAELAYKKFIPHTWSNGIGLAANLHLAASLPNCPWFEFPLDPPAWTDEARDFMLSQPFEISSQGTITVSDLPGLGIVLDEAAVTRYTTHAWQSQGQG